MRNNLLALTVVIFSANCFAKDLACKAYGHGLSAEIFSNEDNTLESKVAITFTKSLAWYPSTKFELVYSSSLADTIIIAGKELASESSGRRAQAFQIHLHTELDGSVTGILKVGDYGRADVYNGFLAKHRDYDIQCF